MILINELSVFFKAHSDEVEVEENKNEINYLHLNRLNILHLQSIELFPSANN